MIVLDDRTEDSGPSISLDEGAALSPAKIRVVGIGGAGGNAVNRMIDADLSGIEFLAANTDIQALDKCRAKVKMQLGLNLTRGLGAGGEPDIGRQSALEDTDRVLEHLEGSDMVFLTAGLGGGTGTGAAPILASLASEIGALTVAVVTQPFAFEGRRRSKLAEQGLEELRNAVDTVIAIPNERLLSFVDRGTPLTEAFRIADDVLRQAVQGISDLITVPGEVNVDFADVKAIMKGMGMALMGTGIAKGENRALEAAQRAISSPLLEDTSIDGAKGVLINISGGDDLALHEMAEAANIVADAVDVDANIITGMVVDPDLGDEMKVTVIATGFNRPTEQRKPWLEPRAASELDESDSEIDEGAEEDLETPSEEEEELRVYLKPEEPDEPTDSEEREEKQEKIPFYKKALAHMQGDDPEGFGPNWKSVDDYEIPTVLRKNMD